MLSFKYRVYPSGKQVSQLKSQMQIAKQIYNLLLEKCEKHYKETGKTFTQFDMNKYVTTLKTEHPEFKQLHSQVCQNICKRIAEAYKSFFRRVKEKQKGKKVKAGFPRFKKFVSSLTYPQSGFKFTNERRLHLSRIGNIPIILHRLPRGTAKTCSIKQYPSGKWFAGFSVETPEIKFKTNGKPKTGIDVGLTTFAATSEGIKIDPPKYLRCSEARLTLLQRRVSKKQLGSLNRRKAKFRLAKLHEKISNQRFDFLHKLSRQHVNDYGLIAVEKLNVSNMIKNHRLAKSISDASWSTYLQMLAYKAESAGCRLIEVDPRNTSKKCSKCGNLKDMPLKLRQYDCPVCNFCEDRDVNAAINILERATVGLTGSYACEEASSTFSITSKQDTPLKQELDEADI